ncbi:MAG: hypothetical protein N2260_04890 [Syntrophobacterales bacterium]|nr:hypothetical protein [Syntrophobacterales bacterium]
MVRHTKFFVLGVALTVGFFVVLWIMFSPFFGGKNGLQAADDLFNSISKGSAYYMKDIAKKVTTLKGQQMSLSVKLPSEQLAGNVEKILVARQFNVTRSKDQVKVSGDVGLLLENAIEDSEFMYQNKGEAIRSRYGIPEKEAMYAWWNFLRGAQKALMDQKQFAQAKVMNDVITKAVEVGYNFYGINAKSIKDKVGIVTFALVFYVIYTMWWGYAIFYLFEGLGLEMKAGKKKEA